MRTFKVTVRQKQVLDEYGIKTRLGDSVIVPSEYLPIIVDAEAQQAHSGNGTEIGVARALTQMKKDRQKKRPKMNRTEKLLAGVIVVLLLLLGATIAKGQESGIKLDVQQTGVRQRFFAAGTVRLNCGSGMTCAWDAVNARVNVSATGTGGVGGTGSTNKLPLWNSGTSLGDSIVTQISTTNINIGGKFGVNQATPLAQAHIRSAATTNVVLIVDGAVSQTGDLVQIGNNGSVVFTVDAYGRVQVTPTTTIAASNSLYKFTGANQFTFSNAAFELDSPVRFNLGRTVNITGGGAAIANYNSFKIDGELVSANAAQTVTNAATLYVGSIGEGLNITMTNRYAAIFDGNTKTVGASLFSGQSTFTLNPILSAQTDKRVPFINSSKVLTSDAGLQFDAANKYLLLGQSIASSSFGVIRMQSQDMTAPFEMQIGRADFSGVADDTWSVQYNTGGINPAKPRIGMNMEGSYHIGGGTIFSEWNWSWTDAAGIDSFRPFSMLVNNTTEKGDANFIVKDFHLGSRVENDVYVFSTEPSGTGTANFYRTLTLYETNQPQLFLKSTDSLNWAREWVQDYFGYAALVVDVSRRAAGTFAFASDGFLIYRSKAFINDVNDQTKGTAFTFKSYGGGTATAFYKAPATAILQVMNASGGDDPTTFTFDTVTLAAPKMQVGSIAHASLGTPANGTFLYCSDCTKATPCAAGGSGAFAKRINGAWDCN